jgi:hypothetical protein
VSSRWDGSPGNGQHGPLLRQFSREHTQCFERGRVDADHALRVAEQPGDKRLGRGGQLSYLTEQVVRVGPLFILSAPR